LLPEAKLRYSVHLDRVVPHFLGANDHPWLRGLLEEMDRFAGRRQRELDERLREASLGTGSTGHRTLAIDVARRLWGSRRESVVAPRAARAALFGAAAEQCRPRDAIVAMVADHLGHTSAELEQSLFADLPGERVVVPPEHPISPGELALRANLMLAQGLLFRATSVVIEAEGNARTLVRHARLRGLICTVARGSAAADATLHISGPFALFRHTLVYGRALGELLPLCAWCHRFRLRARCVLRDRPLVLELGPNDPVFPAAEPQRHDSRLEERFDRDFRRLAPDWDIIREPEAVRAGDTLVFPDFALQHRTDCRRRWLVEIAGFWTPEYLARKLAQYRAAGLSKLILCIDEARDCADGDVPADATVVRFRKRVDAAAVLAIVEGPCGS
jgi:predicted nuclease of restriction endonuclease-like RecB superfamily